MMLVKPRLSAHFVDGLENALRVKVKFYRALQAVLNVFKLQNVLTRFRILGFHSLVFRAAFFVLVQKALNTEVVQTVVTDKYTSTLVVTLNLSRDQTRHVGDGAIVAPPFPFLKKNSRTTLSRLSMETYKGMMRISFFHLIPGQNLENLVSEHQQRYVVVLFKLLVYSLRTWCWKFYPFPVKLVDVLLKVFYTLRVILPRVKVPEDSPLKAIVVLLVLNVNERPGLQTFR